MARAAADAAFIPSALHISMRRLHIFWEAASPLSHFFRKEVAPLSVREASALQSAAYIERKGGFLGKSV